MKTKTLLLGLLLTTIATGAMASGPDWEKPNSLVTPGVTNPAVTQANIAQNVCKANWTSTVRPTVSYTNKLKATQLATTYKSFVALYGAAASGYEEDHLISLQLGGSPTDPKNLWPEPYSGSNARKKDVIETKLKNMICSGQITLAEAQKAIAIDWVAAYKKYTVPADVKVADSNG